MICIPTTAGTGSEVSASGVFTDEDNHIKVGAMSNYLRPAVAIVDPRLTLSCPRKVTADSGIDAMTHAIEAFTAVDNADFPLPPGETLALSGSPSAGRLPGRESDRDHRRKPGPRRSSNPHDLAAREAMSLGAMLAGLAFSNVGVALVHALEYPLGGGDALLARRRQRHAAAVRDALQPAGARARVRPHRPVAGRGHDRTDRASRPPSGPWWRSRS